MLGVGIPSSGEQMNYDLAQIVILSFINVLGTTVVTVKVYCSMLAGIAYLYSIALSQATQIVLGYLFGAGKFDMRSRRRVWVADLIAVVLTTGRVHAHAVVELRRCVGAAHRRSDGARAGPPDAACGDIPGYRPQRSTS